MDEEEFNMKRTNTILYLVVPCYNEEEVLHKSAAVLLDKLDRLIQAGTISDKSKILFINDGSKDSTWQIIYELPEQQVCGLKLFPQLRSSERDSGGYDGCKKQGGCGCDN